MTPKAPHSSSVLIAAVVLALAAVGCASESIGASSERPIVDPRLRFVAEDAPLLAHGGWPSENVFRWAPETGCAGLEPQHLERERVELAEGVTLRVASDERRVVLVPDVAVDAAEVDAVEVVLRRRGAGDPYTGRMVLRWAAETRGLAGRGSRRDPVGAHDDEGRRYRFELVGAEGWDEGPRRLRIVLMRPVGAAIDLCSVRGLRERPNSEILAELVRRGAKARLGSQYRNALPADPRVPVERELLVPDGAFLRFAYGAEDGLETPVELEVVISADDGSTSTLFEAVLEPGGDDVGRWREASLDLGTWAGRTASLSLRTDARRREPRALAWWGHPEVLAPREDA